MMLSVDKYERSIRVMCPTCGGTEFAHDEAVTAGDALFKCTGCGLELTKDELMSANRENLSMHAHEMGDEAVKDLTKSLRDTLSNAFNGSPYIRIK